MPPAEAPSLPQARARPAQPPIMAWPAWLRLGLLIAALVLLSFVLPPYMVFLMTAIPINAMLARSVGLIAGQAGVLSLAQLGFAGVGAWVATWCAVIAGWPMPVVVLIGGLVAVPFGVLVTLPALRLRGVNLASVTLAFASAVSVFLSVNGFPGGITGGFVTRPDWASSERHFFWFELIVAALVFAGLEWLSRGRIGSAWLAVRQSERAAASLGLNVPWVKLTAFMASSFVAGVGGALIAFQVGTPSPNAFGVVGSLVQFALAIFIGTQFLGGAIAAGLFSVLVPEVMRRVGVPGEFGDVLFSLGAIQALAQGLSIEERRLRELEAARVATLSEPVTVPLTAVTPADRPEIRPAAANAIPALEVQNLGVNYGAVAALAGVSFSVPQGSVTALIGPNGAGKSTLIDAVTGFVARPSGLVKLEGQALEGLAPHQRVRLGVRRSFQQDRCIADLRVRDYLRLAAGRELNAPEVQSALDFCGVTRDDVFIYGLDVGTRRLLEVAAALCARPKIVLLDEPAAGLSASESAVLSRRIAEIPARYGCAVLLVEHDMDVVRAACSRAVVLDFGQVIAQGECQSVLADPRVARAYLGEGVEA